MTIETKYNVGDEVWVMYNNKPTRLTIAAVDINILRGRLELDRCRVEVIYYIEPFELDPSRMSNSEYIPYNRSYREKDVFPTKEELLKSL